MFNFLTAIGLKQTAAEMINNMTAQDYYDRLQLITMSMFEWSGLPPSCNARYLEKTLYLYGRAIFFQDETLGYMTLKANPSGRLNNYDEPVSYTAWSTQYNQTYERDNCVIIRNNYLERPTNDTVLLFAYRLTETERTTDVNIKALKTPLFIRANEKDRLSIKNLYKQFDGNEPMIVGSKSLDLDSIKVLRTDAPFLASQLQSYKHEIWNEFLTFCGINNANSDKRERLITDEVNANNEVISINAMSMLLTRQEACKAINEKYGLNVSVKLRTEPENKAIESEEADNEQVHDRA